MKKENKCKHANTKEVGGSGRYFKCYDCDKIIDRREEIKMKKILLLIVITMMVVGCSSLWPTQDEYADSVFSARASGHNLYYGDFSEILVLEDISTWIMARIVYVPDKTDSWDDPEVVLERGYGDCDDYALLVMNIAYIVFGIEFDLVLVDTNKVKIIEEGGTINHASVAIEDLVLNVYNLSQYSLDVPIAFRYNFWYVFNIPGVLNAI